MKPFSIRGHEFYLGASIGIAIYPSDGKEPEVLVRNSWCGTSRRPACGGKSSAAPLVTVGYQACDDSICEMPTTLEAAQKARELGLHIVMGAPNYYRGGSHCGNLSCVEALERDLVDVLCSDYHFPSLLGAAVKMLERGIAPSTAVNLLTRNAARALNRDAELGSIETGRLADLVLFAPRAGYAEVSHTWVGGRLVFQLGQARPQVRRTAVAA